MSEQVCATENCDRPARWYSIPEGNAFGSKAPRRCEPCCNAICEAIVTLREPQEHRKANT